MRYSALRSLRQKKIPDAKDLAWQKDAACVGEPLSTFFPEGAAEEAATAHRFRQLCGGCPVRTACLDYAVTQPEKYGTWGGLNEEERASERRRRLRKGLIQQPPSASKGRKQTPRSELVSAIGSARRLRAAAAAGHLIRSYARMSGVSEVLLSKVRSGGTPLLPPDRARLIADAYPLVLALESGGHRVALRDAAEHGWHGPDAWTEASIDDPDARPLVHETAA